MSIVQRLLGANPDRDSGEVAGAASAGVVLAVVALVAYIPRYNIVFFFFFFFFFFFM